MDAACGQSLRCVRAIRPSSSEQRSYGRGIQPVQRRTRWRGKRSPIPVWRPVATGSPFSMTCVANLSASALAHACHATTRTSARFCILDLNSSNAPGCYRRSRPGPGGERLGELVRLLSAGARATTLLLIEILDLRSRRAGVQRAPRVSPSDCGGPRLPCFLRRPHAPSGAPRTP
jgi:hypothetical protein